MMKLCLDINNCHLTEKTFNGLNRDREPYAYRYPEGLFLPVPDHSMADLETYPEDLRKLFTYVWESGISLIHMDRDADIFPKLPVYRWEDTWHPVYLSKEEVRAYWESNSICIEFSDGSDALAQENGYTMEKCLQMEDVKFFWANEKNYEKCH